jgi:hypothetical protein
MYLGILQRLPAAVVVRHLRGVRVCDFDVKAVHAVVFDLEIGDARAIAFAAFQRNQVLAAVVLNPPQFVELGVESVVDHTPFTQNGCGLGQNRACEQSCKLGQRCKVGRERRKPWTGERRKEAVQIRKQLQSLAQSRKIAWPRVPECDARGDALDVHNRT